MRFRVGIGMTGLALLVAVFPAQSEAGGPKLDKATCDQLHTEQTKFVESGILKDIERGADWGKTNLSAERLREVEHYILLDEQIKFGCREDSLTDVMLHAGEIAKQLELNSDADPFAPSEKPQSKKVPADKKPKAEKPANKPEPATSKPEPKPEKNGAAPTTGSWSAKVTPKKLPWQAEETRPKTRGTREAQELNWPPQLWPRPSATQ